jgi:hypothetical protein
MPLMPFSMSISKVSSRPAVPIVSGAPGRTV